jgi:aarF domain-containing kinase
MFSTGWIANEFRENIIQEFDFRNEATNSEEAKTRFLHKRNQFYIPTIYWDLTTKGILTMEYIRGIKISNVNDIVQEGLDMTALRNTLIEVFSEMIFVHGIVHCDPVREILSYSMFDYFFVAYFVLGVYQNSDTRIDAFS